MGKRYNRNSFSLLNAISAMCLTITNGLLTIVVTRFILARFGSDFNGLNSTANQIVNVLLILEGGFTLASNVALFYPLTHGDYKQVTENYQWIPAILWETKSTNKKHSETPVFQVRKSVFYANEFQSFFILL